MEELKPCPFCGGKLEITKHFRDDLWRAAHRCSAVGIIQFDWKDDVSRIIAAWNTRHH